MPSIHTSPILLLFSFKEWCILGLFWIFASKIILDGFSFFIYIVILSTTVQKPYDVIMQCCFPLPLLLSNTWQYLGGCTCLRAQGSILVVLEEPYLIMLGIDLWLAECMALVSYLYTLYLSLILLQFCFDIFWATPHALLRMLPECKTMNIMRYGPKLKE